MLIPGQTAELWLAKTRLASLKAITIPRLELLAILIATSKGTSKEKSTSNGVERLSNSPLLTIQSSTQSRFVENRLKECRQVNVSFQHVSIRENPADSLSRRMSPGELKTACGEMDQHGYKMEKAYQPEPLLYKVYQRIIMKHKLKRTKKV